ncbi:MAG: glucuronyl hydrolase, partial [Bacteroidota bacterium]
HAQKTLHNHFRKDNSSYHVIDYFPETGEVRKRNTHQGHSHESAWSRGQAWGLYGFTVAYRETKNSAYLEQAKKIADFFFTHPNMPDDKIPYWDFDAPNIPNEERDASAAAIAASGLIELSQHDTANKDKYLKWADQVLASLSSKAYEATTPPFFVTQSVGSKPHNSEINVPINYADYYFVEALLRRKALLADGSLENIIAAD